MEFSIRTEGLNVTTTKRPILKDIDLSIPTGQFTAIVGPNGSGKTTLLKAILGMIPKSTGRIYLNAQDLASLTPKERAEKLAWLPQKSSPSESISVLDYLRTARYRFAEPHGKSTEIALQALEQINMDSFKDRLMCTLSGGEIQKISFANLWVQETTTLLVDEPGNHLDPSQQVQLYKNLGKEWAIGKTIICVTHDINALRHLGPKEKLSEVRILGLNFGNIQFDTHFMSSNLRQHLQSLFKMNYIETIIDEIPYFCSVNSGELLI
ncbi:MAG: ABC transporter ATP-binding protein [Myxococcota bacterium]|nr:ABC transporter ATP-binding protein [Myxococcota bacterium]